MTTEQIGLIHKLMETLEPLNEELNGENLKISIIQVATGSDVVVAELEGDTLGAITLIRN